jgi:hypothetical protein
MAHTNSTGLPVRWFVLFLAAILPASCAIPLEAEESQERSSGFSVRAPRVFIGGHAGLNVPRARSDLFTMITRELTLGRGDFRAPIVGFDIGIPFHSHYAAIFSIEYGRTSPMSESRNYLVEDTGDPIRQTSRLSQLPVTSTLRYYPRQMGETIGSYAWIPRRILPYIAGGGGVIYYSFSQWGDFVNNKTLDIISGRLKSDGFAATGHVAAGMDIGITPGIFANVETRYSWAKADLSSDFSGFQPIDLRGLRVIGGIYFRF